MEVALKRIADVVRRTRGCVVSSAIEARFIPGMGVGIVACEHIPKDTLVFQAGHDAWNPFSAEHAPETAQQKAPGFLKQWNQLLESNKALRESCFVPSAIVLGVHMLVNFPHAKDLDATLKTIGNSDAPLLDELYVNALPRSVDLPLFWNDRQFEELQGCEEARRTMQHGFVTAPNCCWAVEVQDIDPIVTTESASIRKFTSTFSATIISLWTQKHSSRPSRS